MLFKGVICFAVYVDFSSALSLYPSDATALVESCRVILALHGLGCHEATTASNRAEFTVLAFSEDGRTLSLSTRGCGDSGSGFPSRRASHI